VVADDIPERTNVYISDHPTQEHKQVEDESRGA
jgi:hypothetical protein